MFEHIKSVVAEGGTIEFRRLDHPACASQFIRRIRGQINQGYKELTISCSADTFFPNACVPIAGIIQYYKRQGITFKFDFSGNPNLSYLNNCQMADPISFSDEDDLGAVCPHPFDKVFKFSSIMQIAKLSQAYVNRLSSSCVCESGVLDSISWCINEVMDNVLLHSECPEGYVMAQHHPTTNLVSICVYDSGIGIFNSLCGSKTLKHRPQKESDALTMAIQEGVGDGKGQGNGMFGLYEMVRRNGGLLSLTSGGSSIMLLKSGDLKRCADIPFLSRDAKQTIIDFRIYLNNPIDYRTIFSSIPGGFEPIDIRIDDMLGETDDLLHYDVYANSKGTATREAGELLRNDVLNTLRRTSRALILDFSQVQFVSSSFIDEFIAKLVLEMGFMAFNERIRISHMNENVAFLCQRSLYMRIAEEWTNRAQKPQ